MDGGSSRSRLHVVIFPWLAFGHLLPGLELARRLAARGHLVSFVSTPRNLARLPPLPPALAPRVDLVPLPLPHVECLPEGAESTNDVPFDAFELHRKAFDGLAAPFAAFLDSACSDEDKRPDWVLVDNFHHWAASAAADRKVPCAMLLHCPASIFAAFAGQPQPEQAETGQQQGAGGEGQPAAAPRFETEQSRIMYNTEGASGISVARRLFLTLQRCSLVAMRTCVELEPEALSRLPTLFGKPVVPFGLLPPSPDGGRAAGKDGNNDDIVSWLDAQPAETVVYVALGSEVPLSIELMHELALGLELAGARFLWGLRKPHGVPDADILPPGFEERTRGRGLVAMGWVPQISILAHDAVGAFLTHCGWNSIIEGLLFGHPLIMLPIHGDQGPNARLMEGRKIGVQVPRDENDGSFDRRGVTRAVRAVMLEQESRRVLVANTKKLQEIVADKECHERCIDDFVQRLRSYYSN
ncbi:putative UDP-rhamnose:rhamnosyltransferase 1 [Phragmites australis]|uniref:putative UDP-rhamnose:rhamnosyltransferase 1 n=1 Tax=Phragmites australis TaxID=29695 RepID=UPI002D771F48|nr:putative UDP-rhamnose:rhamnosyltransferase 1 [Phragmites australis]